MSMYFDARINNGNNGSNDDTMFGKGLKTSLKSIIPIFKTGMIERKVLHS